MMVRNEKWLALALAVTAGMGAFARAADFSPSLQTLDQMGLAGISVMSDEAGLAVRGFGYNGNTGAYGYSWASVATPYGSAGSVNGYYATGKKSSAGSNYSEAGIVIKKSGGHGGGGHGGGCNSCGGGGGGKGLSVNAFSGGGSSGHR